ncbi:membrane protein [Polymorphobacter glacialis]|uniref:Membrane protein n=1 Tax=Sandarakinorhabdus glacialis TaxID=1614636 RepID=A0A916ZTN1_9SPHN|nr:AsmA family protein [Polymorphobacter glacialis]GGE13557.1 membrane protein [Polymorphobacter glacialis]
MGTMRVTEPMDVAAPPSTEAVPERARRRRRIWQVLAAIAIILIGLYIYQYVTKGTFWKSTFESFVSKKAGRPVKVAGDFELYLDPDIRFRADGLTVANPDWAEADQFFAARSIRLDASLWKAIFGRLTVNDLVVDGGRLALQRRADRTNTWTFGGGELEIPDVIRAAITDSRIALVDAPTATRLDMVFGDIAGTAAKGSQSIAGPLTFTGKGSTRGAPFSLEGRLTTPNEAALGGRLGLDVAGTIARTRITLAGTLPGATRIDGANLRVTAAGRNFQDPGRLFGIILPATRPYRLAANLTKIDREFRFSNLTGRIGDSDLAGNLVAKMAANENERFRIDGTLNSRTLDIKDVGPLIGYDPERLEAGKGVVTQVAGRPRVLPDAPLAVDALGKFDARIDYRAKAVRTGKLPFDNLHLVLGLDNRVLTLSPFAFDIAGGRLIAKIGINARNLPVLTDYDIRLTQIPLGRVLTGFNVEDAGTTASIRGRLQLKGQGDTIRKSLASSTGRIALVVPTGMLWVRNIELAELDLQNFLTAMIGKKLKEKRQINCGVVAFTVTDGQAVADPILIDTNKAVFRGRGGFSFKDEALAMSLEADSKQFSLFSGQSPIGVGGYFADPSINPISGELLARGAAAVGLGLVATPVAAIAAFIDLGDAKDVNCTPILAAKRDTARSRAENAKAKN